MQIQVNYAGCPVNVDVPDGHGVDVKIVDGRLIVNIISPAAPESPRIDEQAVMSPKPRTRQKASEKPQQERAKGGRKLSDDKRAKYQEALDLVAGGMPKSKAAKQVGVSASSFYSWTRKNA